MDSRIKFIIEDIQTWIKSEEYKDEPNTYFDKKENIISSSYIALYPTDQEIGDDEEEDQDEEKDPIDLEIPLTVYINADKSFKIELDKGMFYLFYKGYETAEVIEVVNNLLKYARGKGILFGELNLLKAEKE